MDRATQITRIIAQRQSKAKFLQTLRPKWKELYVELQSLQLQLTQLRAEPAIAPHLQDLDFSPTLIELEQKLDVIADLEQRLIRDHLSIGVVGQMGQGKSRLLQSITGLGSEAIPTGSTGVCTSALSKIFHVSAVGSHIAEIDFYDWETFRDDVLSPYYDNLQLSPKPRSIEEFAAGIPPLPSTMRNDRTSRIYGRFRTEYWLKFDKYRKGLTGSTEKLTSLDDLRHYLIHHRDADTRTSWDDLCVREIRIFHQFADASIGKIAVMDSPGYGDNNAYDVKRLIRALKRDIDFVLFTRMVDGVAFRWSKLDEELMGVVSDALGDFPIGECSYLIANVPSGANAQIAEQQFATLKKHIQGHAQVHDSVLIDCADSAAVQQKVLSPVLNHLEKNIESIYNNYLDRYERELLQLQQKMIAQLTDAMSALDQYGGSEDIATFNTWFDETLWKTLSVGMRKILQDLDQKRNQDDTAFEQEIEKVIERCRSQDMIPSEVEIEAIRAENKGSYKIAYYSAIHNIGERLSDEIGKLNYVIQKMLDTVKKDVSKTLLKAANLTALDQPSLSEGTEFFTTMSDAYLKQFQTLEKSFRYIGDYKVSIDNMTGSWVRKDLDELAPDRNIDPLSRQVMDTNLLQWLQNLSDGEKQELLTKLLELLKTAMVTLQGNPTVEPILSFVAFALQKAMKYLSDTAQLQASASLTEGELVCKALLSSRDQVVTACNETLKQKLKEPNYFAYDMAKKFADRILSESAETQWRNFLGLHRSKVCPACKDTVQRSQIKDQWRSKVQSVLSIVAGLDRL